MPSTNKFTDFIGQDFFIGLDVHRKSWAVTIRSLELELAHFTQPPDARLLARHLRSRFPGGNFLNSSILPGN